MRGPWPFHLAALFAIVAVAGLRVWFLLSETSLSLSTDEAHYWDWSRHLDYCYYSKGPLVAWLIRASCWLCGADTMPAVRFPAVICSALTQLGIYLLIYRIFRDARFACFSIVAAQTLPFLHVGGLLMTIDAPFVLAWTWAILVAHTILFSANTNGNYLGWWSVLGVIVAVGVLAKHNMALFVPSLSLFLLLSTQHRRELLRPGFWLMTLIGAVVGGGPILWWNSQHGWVTFLHVGTQAGFQSDTATLRWFGPLEFIGMQAGLLLGFWFVLMVLGLVRAVRQWRQGTAEAKMLFLVAMALPVLLICFFFSFKVRIEPNWPITSYVTGLVLAAWELRDKIDLPIWRRMAIAFCAIGLFLSMLIHFSEWLYPIHQKLMPEVSVRKWDATSRLKGWPTLAADVQELSNRQSQSPMILGTNWSLTGALAFHLPGRPTVYCLGPVSGSRQSQYDFWRPNPVFDPTDFAGRDAIIVGDVSPQVRQAFESVEETKTVYAKEQGLVVAQWPVTVAHGFKPRGFGQVQEVKH
jgi:4-amino-4-deoxy-L-arabinose transferase-like glycosyltransferase